MSAGDDRQPGISNYFEGADPAKWFTRLPHFGSVVYKQIYPGIDLKLYFKDDHLEYDLVVAPGANPRVIRLRSQDATMLLTPNGEMVVSSDGEEIVRSKSPYAYTENAPNDLLKVHYSRHGKEIGFSISGYDRRQTLVIDPALAFATFLVSNCTPTPCTGDFVSDMVADSTGIYLIGVTGTSNFPSAAGQPPSPDGGGGGFLLKLDPTGSKVLFISFVPASPGRLAVDASGNVYMVGVAGPGFITTPGTLNPTVPAGCGDCEFPVATKLSADGSTLLYSTLLTVSGAGTTEEQVIPGTVALDGQGNLYVGGANFFEQGGPNPGPTRFVTTVGAFEQNPTNPLKDGFPNSWVFKLNPTGSALVYSTYIDAQTINSLAVDANGSAYLAGIGLPGYPTTAGAFQTTTTSGSSVLTKFSPDGSSLDYSTFFGNGNNESGNAVAVDTSGNAVLVGVSDQPITTTGALCQAAANTPEQGYIGKFNAAGSSLLYSTTLCNVAPVTTHESSVVLDAAGSAYVVGDIEAGNAASNFPLLQPIQSSLIHMSAGTGTNALTVVKLDSSGTEQWGTFLGSTFAVRGKIQLGDNGSVYLLGGDPLFPMPFNSFQPVNVNPLLGTQPPFLAKILPSLGAAVPGFSPAAATFPNPYNDDNFQDVGTSSPPFDITMGNFGDVNMTSVPVISISTTEFTQTNTCGSPLSAGGQTCDINVVFAPVAPGTRTATMTVALAGFPDQTFPLSGFAIGPLLAISPPTVLIFPPEAVNQSSPPETLTLSNTGNGALNFANVQLSGDFSQTNTCGGSVPAGSSCSVQITFTPTAAGKRTGLVTLTDNAPDSPETVVLSGFSGQAAVLNWLPSSVSFAGQIVSTASTASTLTITNIGNLAANVSTVAISGDYSQTNTCVGAAISPNSTCNVQVTFKPTATGQRTGVLTITDNSPNSPETISLTGSALDYTFGVAPSDSGTASITAGQTATYTLSVTPSGSAVGSLSLSCAGAPGGASCSVGSSIQIQGPVQTVIPVSVSTTARSAAIHVVGPGSKPIWLLALSPVLMLLLLRILPTRQTRLRWILAPATIVLLCSGCGGGGNSGGGGGGGGGTPSGSYTITVTATGATGASKTVTLTLNVS